MLFHLAHSIFRTLAVATLLSVALVGYSAAVSIPQSSDVGSSSGATLLVQEAAPTGLVQTPTQDNRATQPPFDPIAERIKYLHDRLRITPAQEPLWTNVAQVMRDSAKAVAPFVKERVQHAKTSNAIDYLSSYEKLGETQLEGIKKFNVTFQALYKNLSDEQKKIADSVFRLGPLSIAGVITELPEQLIAPPPYGYYSSYPPVPPYPYYESYLYYYPYPSPWIWGPPFFGLGTSLFFPHQHFRRHGFPPPGLAGVAPVPLPRPVPPARPVPHQHFGHHGFPPPGLAGVAPVPPPRPVPPVRPVPPIRPLPSGGVGLVHR
jgi:hypothetical protein